MLIRDLGLKEYREIWDLQCRLATERREEKITDTVLLCQHLPVYTIGRSSRQSVPEDLPFPLHSVERGGDLTWHGPGQLIGYPILSLPDLGLTARSYLGALESVLIEALKPFGIYARAIKGFTGLWVGRKKLASIGIAVRSGIAYHGFALNMNNSLTPFKLIHPCKLESAVMTTMAHLLGSSVDELAVTKSVGNAFLHYFGRMPQPSTEAS